LQAIGGCPLGRTSRLQPRRHHVGHERGVPVGKGIAQRGEGVEKRQALRPLVEPVAPPIGRLCLRFVGRRRWTLGEGAAGPLGGIANPLDGAPQTVREGLLHIVQREGSSVGETRLHRGGQLMHLRL